MDLLIISYDNALIYYPNIFLPAISVTGMLTLIIAARLISLFSKKVMISLGKINNNLRQLKKIKIPKIYRVRFASANKIWSIFKFIILIITVTFSSINNFFKYLEQRIRKLMKRIEREILID